MKKPELQPLAENVWLLAQPFAFFGTQIGARTTVIRLADQRLWIHSPGPDLPGVYHHLRQLGEVAYLVAPNPFHHLFLPKALQMFPAAIGYGPAAVQKKHPRLSLTRLEKQAPGEWADEIEMLNLDGLRLGERVFFHGASRTLILTDLLFNLVGDDLPTRLMLHAEGVKGKLGCTRLVSKLMVSDRQRLARVCEQILKWDFARMIMCHGEVVSTDARAGFIQAMAWTGLQV